MGILAAALANKEEVACLRLPPAEEGSVSQQLDGDDSPPLDLAVPSSA